MEVNTTSTNTESSSAPELDFKHEDGLTNVASILLMVGIVAGVILFFSIGIVQQPSIDGSEPQTTINSTGMVMSICTIIGSVTSYFSLQVLGDMSRNLKRLVAAHQKS